MVLKKTKRRFKRFSIKFLWPIIPIILFIALSILLGHFQAFNIKKISCQLDNHPCPLDLEPVLVSFYRQNIFKLKTKKVISQITEFNPTLTNIRIEKQLPDSLSITLNHRQPIAKIIPVENLQFAGLDSSQSATLSAQFTDKLFHLDKNGEVFSPSININPPLPAILIPIQYPLDLGSLPITLKLAELVNVLNSHYVNFDTMAMISSSNIVIRFSDVYAVFDQTKPFNSSVAALQYILSNIKIGEKKPTKIDLRFDKPVLTY